MNAPLRRRLVVTVSAFVLLGVFWGTFAVLLPDLSGAVGLSPGPLGAALLVGALASIVSMGLLGWASDFAGRRVFLLGALVVFGVGVLGLGAVGSFAALALALVVVYAGSGLYDVGINASAIDIEREAGRRLMAYFHASFSAGGLLGAVGSGVLLAAGLDYRLIYASVLLPLVLVALAVALTDLSPAEPPAPEGEIPPGGVFAAFGDRALLLVALVATLGLLSEGEMEHWSGIYLRDTLGLSALVGGGGVAVFFGAMAVGRLAAAPIIHAFGTRPVLAAAGLFAALGMGLSLATTRPSLVVLGFLVVGLALSAIVPIAFSLAGDLAKGRVGSATSVLTTTSYGGFLIGPVLVGGLAELFGLRLALTTIAVAGAAVFLLSFRLGRP
ncbi:Major Facilitator Superfamily [Rubrobacter radiotolerans]|uniref:MFS transporter n=1 Tax=Rubrobacter radiotolerans TaxID=42256 RepID=A0A023X0E1_RUBRA|nr:MFS transporter [Rubrobacter radiotolerans]AHY45661.1 Major Facilitator Superfamily [Rubrobacter radiotolerans]MDX5893075.1 MFS transporter [Rubrobacter radiotolerans]SMC03011.1 Predicted arabinose efflux permease, MFS family [Rubrobacter radiotolerans DSM 5868]